MGNILGLTPSCPTCGKDLSYIEQYSKWYCYNCNAYKEPPPPEPPPTEDSGTLQEVPSPTEMISPPEIKPEPVKPETKPTLMEQKPVPPETKTPSPLAPEPARPQVQPIVTVQTVPSQPSSGQTPQSTQQPSKPAIQVTIQYQIPSQPTPQLMNQPPQRVWGQLPPPASKVEEPSKGSGYYGGIILLLLGIIGIIFALFYNIFGIKNLGPINSSIYGSFIPLHILATMIAIIFIIVGAVLVAVAAGKAKKKKEELEKKPIVMAPLPPGAYPFDPQQQGRR